MKSILFVSPTSTGINALPLPPLGMLSVAAYLRDGGFTVDALDTYIDSNDIELIRRICKADVVGISALSSHQFEDAKRIGGIANALGKKTIVGGVHATVCPDECAGFFDIVVRGEGERTALELMRSGFEELERIDGISYTNKDGVVVHNRDREYIRDLNTLPLPARDLIPPDRYPFRELKRFKGRYTSIVASRGCPNHCIFCVSPTMWKKTRMRSASKIYEEMLDIYDNYKIINIHFHDDTFTLLRSRVIELCTLIINGGVRFKWSCITRPDRVDKNLLGLMKQAGCAQIEMGVESASNELLRVAKKNYNTDQIRRAFKAANEAGLTTYGYFIIGLPGETLSTWIRTIGFARRLNLTSCVFTVLSPFPGTEVYKKGMVTILSEHCWLYKKPVIKVGWLTPTILTLMRKIADVLVNGFGYHGAYMDKEEF